MTGAIPPSTGVRLNGVHRFDGSRPTLATLFKDAGLETAAFVGAFVLDRQFGLATGFDTYDDQITRTPGAPLNLEAERPASAVADRAIAWLRERQQAGGTPRRPYFVWAHFYDPHAPYTPPADARARAGGDAYNGEVAYADAEIGRLLAAVAADDCRPAHACRDPRRPRREPRRARRADARDAPLRRRIAHTARDRRARASLPASIASPSASSTWRRPCCAWPGLRARRHAGPRSPLGLRRSPRGVCRDAVSPDDGMVGAGVACRGAVEGDRAGGRRQRTL